MKKKKMVALPIIAAALVLYAVAAYSGADAVDYDEIAPQETIAEAEELAEAETETPIEAEAPDEYAGWTDLQIWAHETADSARAVGLADDNPIIAECQRIWHEEETYKELPRGIPYDEVEPEYAEPTMTYLGSYYVTGYDQCAQCCGKWAGGPTASGVMPTVNHTVAMCKDFPFGTVIYIDGLGYYTVEDRGVGKGCVDVFVNNHSEAYALTGYRDVYIVEEG